ncbi:hypothetical protein BgiMline_027507 [Biomphalaria glabrata]
MRSRDFFLAFISSTGVIVSPLPTESYAPAVLVRSPFVMILSKPLYCNINEAPFYGFKEALVFGFFRKPLCYNFKEAPVL